MKNSRIHTIAAVAVLTAVVGCTPTVDTHGHVLREPIVAQLQPGMQSRDDVLRIMGSPSSKAAFDDNTWYYIGQKTARVAFFDPSVEERTVVVVRFDEGGTLTSVNSLSADQGKQIALVERETPTAGHELSFMEQLLGNMGRFNAPAGGFGRGGRGGPVGP